MTAMITHWIDGKPWQGWVQREGDVYDPALGQATAKVALASPAGGGGAGRGARRAGRGGAAREGGLVRPARGQVAAKGALASPEDVDVAVVAAREAWHLWR